MHYTLDSQSEAILQQQLNAGRFNSSEEILREGLLLVQAREEKLANLRTEIEKGANSTEWYTLDEVCREALEMIEKTEI